MHAAWVSKLRSKVFLWPPLSICRQLCLLGPSKRRSGMLSSVVANAARWIACVYDHPFTRAPVLVREGGTGARGGVNTRYLRSFNRVGDDREGCCCCSLHSTVNERLQWGSGSSPHLHLLMQGAAVAELNKGTLHHNARTCTRLQAAARRAVGDCCHPHNKDTCRVCRCACACWLNLTSRDDDNAFDWVCSCS